MIMVLAQSGPAGAPSAIAIAADLTLADLRAVLAAGWRDFAAAPIYGLFFAGIYVVLGAGFALAMLESGNWLWLSAAVCGFPLLAPFTAVGLYEVSRRREAGQGLAWKPVLGALAGRGDQQLWMIGGVLFVGFSFWVILAHAIFAIAAAEAGPGHEGLALLGTWPGLVMLAGGGVIGAGVAWLFYAITVISLPLLVARDVDFITAIIASVRAVRANRSVMLAWAAGIAGALALAMAPLFLGLLVVLPVLGHATWHLYQRLTQA